MNLVTRLIPEPTLEERVEALGRMSVNLAAEGMTAVKDPGIDLAWWAAYKAARAGDRLRTRVFALWRAGKTVEEARDLVESIAAFTYPRVPPEEDWLVSLGVKMMIDGSGGARTAWLHDEWNKEYTGIDEGNRGYPVIDPEVYRQQFRIFHDAGLHVGTHAIGDRAIDWVAETYEAALAAAPKKGLRHSIIHCNLPTAAALERIARLQKEYDAGYPEVSSTFLWWLGDTYAGNWGPQRSERLVPLRTFQERGIVWGGGSDFSVTPFPARYGLWASNERRPLLGVHGERPFGDREAVDVRAALRSYTIWNARLLFMEDRVGSIEPGKLADLAVWDRNPYSAPPAEIKEMRCLLTFLGGEIVHRAPTAPPGARNLGNPLQGH